MKYPVLKRKPIPTVDETLESILKLIADGCIPIGITRSGNWYYVSFIFGVKANVQDESKEFCLCPLPYEGSITWKSLVFIDISNEGYSYLHDVQARPMGYGYGTMLMRQILAYLHDTGVQTVKGKIMPTDFGHREMLHHFYHDIFNFEVFKHERSDTICLKIDDKCAISNEAELLLLRQKDGVYDIDKIRAFLTNAVDT